MFTFAKDLSIRFVEALENSILGVGHGDTDRATAWLKRAILMNARLEGLMNKILALERSMSKLTEGELEHIQQMQEAEPSEERSDSE